MIFERQVGPIMGIVNSILVKFFDLILESLKLPLLESVSLYAFHDGQNEITYCLDEILQFGIEWSVQEVIIQIANEVHPALLLRTGHRVIPRIKI